MKAILRFSLCAAVAILAAVPPVRAQATLGSLSGTYTFVFSGMSDYSPAYNMNLQQVGFCIASLPVGYNCGSISTFNVITGTLVADGVGHITSGTFTQTNDPNSYECNPGNNPTSPCPVKVPSGNEYSQWEMYNLGAVVDYTAITSAGRFTRTFQAVRPGSGKTPDWTDKKASANICTSNNLDTCYWDQVTASLTNSEGSGQSANIVGTYSINANGSGTISLKLANCSNNCAIGMFAIVVPSGNSTVGQTVHVSGQSQLGNHNKCVGGATRIK